MTYRGFATLELVELPDRVVATLNRPESRNAIDLAMVEELHAVCELVERGQRALLITGAGGTFAAGADISQLQQRGRDEALSGINSRLFDRIARLPALTVAAIDGPALGGGAELAYACDIRIVTPTARFGNPEPGLGILPAAGACWRLAELVGKSVAKQVLLGGFTLDAEQAMRIGLAGEIAAPEELLARAHRIIDRTSAWSPLALRLTKLVLDNDGAHPLADDLAQAILFDTQDKRDRMTAFLERSGQ
jgi:enoyl-CoA hydratase/carnithine racemase